MDYEVESMENEPKKIAVIGGTGNEGKGLAYSWSKFGHTVIVGSREEGKALIAAADINARIGREDVVGMENLEAASKSDVIVLTVPYAAHRATLEYLKPQLIGKLLIDVTVPLVPPKVTKVQMPPSGSAAQEALEVLGDSVDIVDAFQNISYEHFNDSGEAGCDVLVTGSSKDARMRALELVKDAGFIGWDAGPIENSVVVEGLTSILIYLNKQYGSHSAGIKITGLG